MNMNLKGIMKSLKAQPGQVIPNPYVRAFSPMQESEGSDHEVSEGLGNDIGDKVYFKPDSNFGKKFPSSEGYYAIIQDVTPARNYNMNALYKVVVHDKDDNKIGAIRADWTNFSNKPINENHEGQDHEVSMAKGSLEAIIKHATELMGKLGDTEKDIPGWIQDHIAKSENYIQQASSNYHEYSTNEAGINGAPRFPSLDGVANESVNEEEIKWNAVENAIINFLKANTKILDKRVKDRDTEGVKGGLKSIISGLTSAQRNLKLESVNENFAKFDTLKMAVNQHEKGAPYYDKIRLINIFNQLSSSDQVKAKKQYRGYFGESVNEVSRRATDFYGDSKYGKSIDLLLKGKWDSKKVENFLEKLGGGNDVKYARIIDFISGDAGLNIRKYKNIGEQLPELMKQLEVLYKDFLTESVNKSLRLTKLK
jgi:hypothetical protein